MKYAYYIFLLLIFISCNKKDRFSYLDLSESLTLDSAEVIYTFEDKYPVSLKAKDSLIFVIQVQSDTCVSIININTKNIVTSIGQVGYGSEDLLSPNFILSTDNHEILLEDGNLKKIAHINIKRDSIRLSKYIEYPEDIFISSELNISNNFIVGRKVDAIEGKMFFIYNRNEKTIIEKNCFPELSTPVSDYNYTFAPVLALNEKQNRVIAGMYFFDMFHVYDLEGNRINTFCFSKNNIPNVNPNTRSLDLRNGYSGIIRTYPTKNYCYLLRYEQNPNPLKNRKHLIKINWNGDLIKSYYFTDDVSGQFYIDEKSNKIYIIRNHMNPKGEDFFDIVSYSIK
ncbi:hypothetical protein [Parabacteroides chongii]|uniref:hypothetical protein n=1 Tax=Parabacteroides chongii TaxID=2685834 RepID=UPI00240E212C|nr:hypothetical protein [Parabacteroides chongii]WFE86597.1 hypothetical protein P3L47_08410 [Parabacteroides chongii]